MDAPVAPRARGHVRRRARGGDRADGRRRAGPARRPAGRAGRQGPDARARAREHPPDQRAPEQLDRGRRPERGLGGPDVRRARPRPALGARRVLRAPRRGRPDGGLARARRASRPPRPRAERARRRRAPLPRPGHRPDGRAAAPVALAGLRVEDRPGHPLRREHADRRGLHDARRPPHGGHRPVDAAPQPLRAHRARPRGAVRGRPHRGRARRRGRGRDPGAAARATSRPAFSARSRWSTAPRASARPTRSSSTRSSTRTRPATSPTAAPTPRRSRAA